MINDNHADNDNYLELEVDYISDTGNGICNYGDKKIVTDFTCVGDIISIPKDYAALQKDSKSITVEEYRLVSKSKQRHDPLCKYFTKCGGCNLQHLNEDAYYEFKQNKISNIIKSLGFDEGIIDPIVKIKENSRRRVEFKIGLEKGDVKMGFFEKASYNVVNVDNCPIIDTKLNSLIDSLFDLLNSLKKPGLLKSISIAILDNGIDIVLDVKKAIKETDLNLLVKYAENNLDIVRLSVRKDGSFDDIESIYKDGEPYIKLGDAKVLVPADAFLQASAKGQFAITEFILKHISFEGKRGVDLYSGCGTYSFPAAKYASYVSSYEGAENMCLAMHNAIINNSLEAKMSVSTRDLFKSPLKISELNNFDVAIINPPRGGALPQIKNIAQSNVKNIAMVSCNPLTFKRDAKELIKSGYKIQRVFAIDQFYLNDHLEVVALFRK